MTQARTQLIFSTCPGTEGAFFNLVLLRIFFGQRHKVHRNPVRLQLFSFPNPLVPRNKSALAQYARSTGSLRTSAQTELFHFSEHDPLDLRKVDEPINADETGTHAFVLLLADAGYNHSWLDPTHCPRTAELCTTLKQRLGSSRITFVVCPTTRSAETYWSQHQLETQEIFGDFSSNSVEVWSGYDPNLSPEMSAIQSLIADAQPPEQELRKCWTKKGWWTSFSLPALCFVIVAAVMALMWVRLSGEDLLDSQLRHWNQTFQEKNKSLAEMSKQNEEERKHLREKKEMLMKWNQRLRNKSEFLDLENQTLQEMSKFLDLDEAEVAKQRAKVRAERAANEEESKPLVIEKQVLMKWNQQLQSKSEFLDHKKAEMEADMAKQNAKVRAKSAANGEEKNHLVQEKQLLSERNQTLLNMSQSLDLDRAAVAKQRAKVRAKSIANEKESTRLRQEKQALMKRSESVRAESVANEEKNKQVDDTAQGKR